jgi:exodeoxyribonuclease V alpha subunit
MTELLIQFRVTSVRHRGEFGGAIFAGVTSDDDYFVAVCSDKIISDPSLIDKGQHWSITGTLQKWHDEKQILASAAEMLRPSGRNLIDWIAQSADCPGIGQVKAARMYSRFGQQLVERIRTKDIKALTEIVSASAAESLCLAFERHDLAGTLLWLDSLQIDRCIGKKIISFFGGEARTKIEDNPYRLISFEADWKKVDAFARNRMGLTLDDPRRLDAAIESVLYNGMRDGHTCLPSPDVHARLRRLLSSDDLVTQAIAMGNTSPQYHQIGDMLQPAGMYIIEQYVAERLQQIAKGEESGQLPLLPFPATASSGVIKKIIEACELAQGFTLMSEQHEAVLASSGANLSLILGGAGTGKTTVLKALYKVMEATLGDIRIYQVALAGRAAQRMSQATGRDSMTIAGFLLHVDAARLGHGSVVVVDEMSMVDVILMYRFLRHIPPGTKLILVGDPSQLPPIGPGLVLHVLAAHHAVLKTELRVSRRQSAASGIPVVADAVREHRVPEFADYHGLGAGVSFVRCTDAQIEDTVRRVYRELHGDASDYAVQVLSITKAGCGGVQNLNMAFHNAFRTRAPLVYSHDKVHGQVGAQTLERVPIRVGDLVMYTENDYNLGLRNGSLGMIVEGFEPEDVEAACCVCEFDGQRYTLNTRQANALTHAYSITVHKAQGSQFKRVIVSIRKSRLLDQAVIYTGLTRGVEQVVLVGDWDAACAAILAPTSATKRQVNLPRFLDLAFAQAYSDSL